MPDYVKLPIGDHLTFQVKAVDTDKSGKWPDYHLTAMDGRIVVAPKAALDRQLERLTMTPIELVGHYVTIERAPNKEDAKKSWWNLSLANKTDATPAATKRLASPHDTRSAGQKEFDAAVPPEGDVEAVAGAAAAVVDEADAAKQQRDEAIRRVVVLYLGLWDKVAAHQVEYAKQHDFPVDGSSVNSAAATIFIELNKRNLLK